MTQQKPYKKRIQEIYRNHVHHRVFPDYDFASEAALEIVRERCQQEFPGNYHVREVYIPEKFGWGLELVFDTAQDETWFLMKYE